MRSAFLFLCAILAMASVSQAAVMDKLDELQKEKDAIDAKIFNMTESALDAIVAKKAAVLQEIADKIGNKTMV